MENRFGRTINHFSENVQSGLNSSLLLESWNGASVSSAAVCSNLYQLYHLPATPPIPPPPPGTTCQQYKWWARQQRGVARQQLAVIEINSLHFLLSLIKTKRTSERNQQKTGAKSGIQWGRHGAVQWGVGCFFFFFRAFWFREWGLNSCLWSDALTMSFGDHFIGCNDSAARCPFGVSAGAAVGHHLERSSGGKPWYYCSAPRKADQPGGTGTGIGIGYWYPLLGNCWPRQYVRLLSSILCRPSEWWLFQGTETRQHFHLPSLFFWGLLLLFAAARWVAAVAPKLQLHAHKNNWQLTLLFHLGYVTKKINDEMIV